MIQLKPETERLLQEEVGKGRFRSVDEMIDRAIHALHEQSKAGQSAPTERRWPRDPLDRSTQRGWPRDVRRKAAKSSRRVSEDRAGV